MSQLAEDVWCQLNQWRSLRGRPSDAEHQSRHQRERWFDSTCLPMTELLLRIPAKSPENTRQILNLQWRFCKIIWLEMQQYHRTDKKCRILKKKLPVQYDLTCNRMMRSATQIPKSPTLLAPEIILSQYENRNATDLTESHEKTAAQLKQQASNKCSTNISPKFGTCLQPRSGLDWAISVSHFELMQFTEMYNYCAFVTISDALRAAMTQFTVHTDNSFVMTHKLLPLHGYGMQKFSCDMD